MKIPKTQDKVTTIPNYAIPPKDFIGSKGNSSTNMIGRKMIQDIFREIPIYPDHPKPEKLPIPIIPRKLLDINPELITDFENNSPFQEGIISETYQRPDKSYFQEPQELESLIHAGRKLQKFSLKEADIDKILKIMQRKVLKGTLPVTVKEIQTGYLISFYYKDLYLYLAQDKLPNTKTTI